jgi:kynurenine formamidase
MAPRLTSAEVKGLFEKCNNWGRWGKDDQRGALNFITDKQIARAGKLVQTGDTASCALPLAVAPAADNPTPVTHLMVQAGHDSHQQPLPYAGDYFAIAFHGMANTHIDALCHVFWEKKMYNGFDASEVGSQGARKCPIDVTRTGVISRGVLLDIPKIRKVDWIANGDRIFPEELDAAEKDHRIHVEEGDILLVRTGRSAHRKAKGAWDPMGQGLPGLDASCLPWLHERKIAVLGSDSISDVIPSGLEDVMLPIHVGTLVMMGIHLIDNADFDSLAEKCKKHSRYEFMFTMAPLILERGTGSPVNPIAIF